MNLASIELNLLLVFNAIMSERHVTRAANKIGMSQPAMSNALNRLRHHLKDELFIRSHEGMVPTPRSIELALPIRNILQNLEEVLTSIDFDPSTSSRTFFLGTNDYCTSILIPVLMKRLEIDAPNINIRLIPSQGRTLEMLDNQEIDFGISAFGDIPEKYGSAPMIDDTYVLLMREGHPLLDGDITLERFLAARHMVVSPKGESHGFVDDDLAKISKTRTIALVINSFSSAAPILANSDLILTAPSKIVKAYAERHSLTNRPAPFTGTKAFTATKLVWHKKLANHPSNNWLREYLIETAKLV